MNRVVFLSLLAILLSGVTAVNSYADDRDNKKQVVVTKVSDGDTIKAVLGNEKVTIRLANIDCPEIRTNDKALKQAKSMRIEPEKIKTIGKDAQKTLKKLLDFYENEIYFKETPEYVCTGEKRMVGILYAGETIVNEYMLENSKCRPFSCNDK